MKEDAMTDRDVCISIGENRRRSPGDEQRYRLER